MFYPSIRQLFESRANREEASWMKKYMRNQFEFLGIKTPVRRALMRELLLNRTLANLSAGELKPLVMELWEAPAREYQYLAMELLDRKIKKADPGILELLEYMIVVRSWWDTVDMIAGHLVGKLLLLHPELVPRWVNKWMESGNIWLQRTAILYQLSYKGKTDERILFDNIRNLASSKEFFIQKAIGWALREYAKTNPEAVIQFVSENQLAPLSRREALRRLEL